MAVNFISVIRLATSVIDVQLNVSQPSNVALQHPVGHVDSI